MDNLDDVRDTQTQAVDAIFRSSGRKSFTRREDDADQRMLLRDRVLHATDARLQHLALVSTDLQTPHNHLLLTANEAVTYLSWLCLTDHVITGRKS